MAKQSAAADALTRKAEQAVRQMFKQQEQLDNRRVALESNGKRFSQDQNQGKGSERKRLKFEEFKQ